MTGVHEIPIRKIRIGEHEQRIGLDDEAIASLAKSIERVGLLYPIIVRQDGDEYVLIEGHRRVAAHQRMGRATIKASVTGTGQAQEAEIAFAGNYFRKDLSPIELGCAIKDCYLNGQMTIEELAIGFHKSKNWVEGMMAIADWPGDIQEAIHNEKISVSAAHNLVCVTDDRYRNFLVRSAVESGATARTTASWLQAWRAMQPAEEAITAVPIEGSPLAIPATPQAPCFCCAQVFPVNEVSHVPICGACVQIIRQIS